MTNLLHSSHYRRIEQVMVSATLVGGIACVRAVAELLSGFDNVFVRYAVTLIVVQGAVQLVLVAGLTLSKGVRSKRYSARVERIRNLEYLLAQPDSGREAQKTALRWPADFLAVVENALQSLAGSTRRRVADLLESSGPYRRLLRNCANPDPSRVIRALSLLGKLENSEARRAVRGCLQHPADGVRRAARIGVVTGGEAEDRRQVLDILGQLPSWERIILFHLYPADETLLEFLDRSFASDNDERLLIAFELVLTRQRLVLAAVPARLAESANVEVRIKFFRSLAFMRLEEGPIPVLERGLHDPDWRVRAAAARACGSLRAGHFAGRLLEMCQSFGNPAEAGHAARALASLGAEGWRRLQEAAAAGSGMGHLIAAEVMERRMMGQELHQ